MRELLRVSVAAVVASGFAVAAPVQGAGGVVLVGCDLFARDGPSVAFVQSHGVSRRNGDSDRRRFASGPSFRAADFEGRPCADVLSEVIDDGLKFQAMDVFGQDADLALWFFREG
ncbi:MAG: hypothetical protein ACREIR_00525 [Geminicoccaceae bacterium]